LRRDRNRRHDHCILGAVGFAAAIFAPCHFDGIGIEIAARDMVMNANLGATDA
jgi:hypothetical protein